MASENVGKERSLYEKTFTLLPVDSIRTLPFSIRVESGEGVDSLAGSIVVDGVLEPLVVRPSRAEAGKFEVVCGVRRLRAAQKAGLTAVPCVVRDMDDFDAMMAMFAENRERENLSDYEVGRWLKLMMEKYPDKFPTQEAVADRCGISRQLVGFLIQHYETIEKLKPAVSPNIATRVAMLPEGIIRAPPEIQPKIVETAVKHELSAREVKDVVDTVTPPSVEGVPEEELMRRAQERVQKEREKRAQAKKLKEASLINALAEWYPDPLIKFVLERVGYDVKVRVAKERIKDFLDVLVCSTEEQRLEEMWQTALTWKK